MDVIIFEDDPEFAKNLECIITDSFKSVEIIANTDSMEEISDYISKMNSPALFFLDIVLGKKSLGLTAARRIMESKVGSLIVFITDYPNKILFHSIFKVNSYNIILKKSPCLEEEIKVTIESALKDVLIDQCFIYQDRFTMLSLDREGIIYVETVKGKKRVCIHHESGVYMLNIRMNAIMPKLGVNFFRCHNSYIVNMKKIAEINHRERKIIMNSGSVCYYSYLKRIEFLNCVKEWKDDIF